MSHSPEFTKAMSSMTCTNVFFTALLYNMKIEARDDLPAVAATDGVHLYYQPKGFAEKLTAPQRVFAIVHELLHVILFHNTRRGIRDPKKWNIACIDSDEPVLMGDGTLLRIGDIETGYIVATPFGDSPVLAVKHSKRLEVMELDFHNGYTLKCTPDHKILTEAGYVAAEDIKAGTSCCVDTRNERLFVRTAPEKVLEGHSSRFGDQGQRCVLSDGTTRIVQEQTNNQTPESEASAHVELCTSGVPGRAYRWRGFGIVSSIFEQERKPVHSACNNRDEHFIRSGSVARNTGIVWDCWKKQPWKSLLALFDIRVPVQGFNCGDTTVCSNSSSAVRHIDGDNNDPSVARTARSADTIHHELIKRVEGFEYARLTVSRRVKEERTVVDITTTTQCFISGGVVVHNCDHAVNLLCLEYQFQVPKWAYQDAQYKGMTAEKIYDLLPEDAGEGSPMSGDVMDYDPSQNDNKPKGDIEREIAIGTEQAAQAAKAAGQDTAGMKRIIGQAQVQREPWYQHLRRWMTSLHTRQYNWSRIDARRAVLHGVVSPQQKAENTGKVVILCDESGSMTDKQRAAIGAHTSDICRDCQPSSVVLAHFDTEVVHSEEYTGPDYDIEVKRYAGGGTDFAAPIQWVLDNHGDAQVILCFTDLYGGFGAEPGLPVLWLSQTETIVPPFGELIFADLNEG